MAVDWSLCSRCMDKICMCVHWTTYVIWPVNTSEESLLYKKKKVLLTVAFFIIYKGKGSLLTSLIISLCTHPWFYKAKWALLWKQEAGYPFIKVHHLNKTGSNTYLYFCILLLWLKVETSKCSGYVTIQQIQPPAQSVPYSPSLLLSPPAGMFLSSSSADIHHIVIPLHQQHMLQASMPDWVRVNHETPWSTATQLHDADKSCHLCTIIQGRMRTHTCSWSYRQTNKCSWGHVERVGEDKMKREEASFSLQGGGGCGGACSLWKNTPILIPNQHNVSRSYGKWSPLPPPRPADISRYQRGSICPKLHKWTVSWRNSRTECGWSWMVTTPYIVHVSLRHLTQHLVIFTTVFVHTAVRPASLVPCMYTVYLRDGVDHTNMW